MSPRDSFWFLAGALVAVAIMVAVRAWLRERPTPAARPDERVATSPAERPATRGIPLFAVPVAAALALVGVALGVYFLLGSPGSIASSQPSHATASARAPMGQSAATAGSLDDVTNKLAARLAAQGGSDNDWRLLAESYEYMGRTAEAQAAKAHIAPTAPTVEDRTGGVSQQMTGDQMSTIAEALNAPPGSSPPDVTPVLHNPGGSGL